MGMVHPIATPSPLELFRVLSIERRTAMRRGAHPCVRRTEMC
jgi:hypothetical protein